MLLLKTASAAADAFCVETEIHVKNALQKVAEFMAAHAQDELDEVGLRLPSQAAVAFVVLSYILFFVGVTGFCLLLMAQ